MPETLHGKAAMESRVLPAAEWRELYLRTARELESTRTAWATCKALKCCSVLCPPADWVRPSSASRSPGGTG